MKKWVLTSTVALLIILITPHLSFAATDPINNMFKGGDIQGSYKPLYTEYSFSNYFLDSKLGWMDVIDKALNAINNVLFAINILITRLTILLLQQAFNLDLLNFGLKYIGHFINSVNKATWNIFSTSFIAISAIVALFNAFISYKRSRAWEQIFVILIVLLVAVVFFNRPVQILTQFDTVSKNISSEVLGASMLNDSHAGTNTNDDLIKVGNRLWVNHVQYPFYMLEFGSINKGEQIGHEFYSLPYGSNARNNLVSQQVNENNQMMQAGGVFLRLIMLVIYIVFTLLDFLVILLFSLAVLMYQLYPLLLISLSGVVLLICLWPGMGLAPMEKWLARIVGASLNKIIFSIILTLYLLLSGLVYQIYASNFILQVIGMLVLFALIIFKRKDIMGMFQAIPNRDRRMAVDGAAPKRDWRQRLQTLDNAVFLGSKAQQAVRGIKNHRERSHKKKLRGRANDFLKEKYTKEKQRADKFAHETGKDPVYSDFVNQVDDNVERGLPLFSQDQLNDATDQLYDIKKQGGNVDHVFLPTGINADNEDMYGKAALDYKNHMEKSNKQLKSRKHKGLKQADFAMEVLSGRTKPKPEKPVPQSDEVRQRQESSRKVHQETRNERQKNKAAESNIRESQRQIAATKESFGQDYKPQSGKPGEKTPGQSDIIRSRQEAAKLARKNRQNAFKVKQVQQNDSPDEPKKSVLQNGVQVKSSDPKSKLKSNVLRDFKAYSGTNEAVYVDELHQQKQKAYKAYKSLDLFEQAEKQGNIDQFKKSFPNEAKRIQELQSFAKQSTGDLKLQAKQNYDTADQKFNAAREALNLKSKSFVEVKQPSGNLERIKVKSAEEFESEIFNAKEVPKYPTIKVDEAFKQGVKNDWNKHQDMGMSRKDYIHKLNEEKRSAYKMLKTFNEAHDQTQNQSKKKEYEDFANRMRHVYLNTKERQGYAKKLLGMEDKKLKSRNLNRNKKG